MIRKIITINESKCNGCGLCVSACHEGAIGLVDGKAKLLCDDYCDGLGNCLPVCEAGAITFEEREAAAFDEAAVRANIQSSQSGATGGGCPGAKAEAFSHAEGADHQPPSQLRQWPVQIKLVPPSAPYLQNAKLLVAADCAAYAYGNFHEDYMKNKVTVIGCPKLDGVDYSEKLTALLRQNDIQSVTLVRMEVPCCGGLEHALKTALQNCGKQIQWQVDILSTTGCLKTSS